jgi:hypothetical protein
MRTPAVMLVSMVLAACVVQESPPPNNTPPATHHQPATSDARTAPLATPPLDAPPPSVLDAAPPAATAIDAAVATGPCRASADQCCKADGTVVTPGGCQPMYPNDVEPATERGPDGFCQRIPCYVKCLPITALIATPAGDIPVDLLAIGDVVWTADEDGTRTAAPIVKISRARVEAPHEMVALSLSDGRTVRASGGHPTANGTPFGDVHAGDRIDGATVVAVGRARYDADHTSDILPAGATGQYWVDRVLIGSTLAVSDVR